MAKSGSNWRTLGVLIAAVALLGAAGAAYYRYATRDAVPVLAVPDIQDDSRQAAHVERMHGAAVMRPALQADEAAMEQPADGRWEKLETGSAVRLGTLFRSGAKDGVELITAGRWYLGLEGEGAFVLQDARRNAAGSEHTLSVFVQKGRFSAKSASDIYKGYFVEVTTAAAHVRIYEGEIGMQVGPGGHGRMWLVSGRAVAFWNDGRRKELGLRGLEDL